MTLEEYIKQEVRILNESAEDVLKKHPKYPFKVSRNLKLASHFLAEKLKDWETNFKNQ